MSDYEMAAMWNEKFPAVEAHGCWFHYISSINFIQFLLYMFFILYYKNQSL